MKSDISILIVDDEQTNVRLLEMILKRAGYASVHSTTDSRAAIDIASQQHPDIVLLDLHMPGVSGLDVMRELATQRDWTPPFIVMLTGDASAAAKTQAFTSGAKDFIAKPFEADEIVLRIRNLADLRLTHRQLRVHNQKLEEKVVARTRELEQARLDIIDRLGMAAEFRDDATGRHTRRVAAFAAAVARALGVGADDAVTIERAAPLHDVGKIAIPDNILLKPGPLDDVERAIMRTHTTIGARLLSGSNSPLVQEARGIALSHHERWDGCGYPDNLQGSQIPLSARIVAIVDFFDALSHDRPYRAALAAPSVLEMIDSERGSHFDPAVVDAFMNAFHSSEWPVFEPEGVPL